MELFSLCARLGKKIAVALVVFVSVVLGANVLEFTLCLNPRLMLSDIPTFAPSRGFTSNQNLPLEVRRSDGDLFTPMDGYIKPFVPADDCVIGLMHLATDHLGLLNAESSQNHFNVIALGDSFTCAHIVSSRWTWRLVEQTSQSVLNPGW